MLGIARDMKPRMVTELPKIVLIDKEKKNTYILPRKDQHAYLAACPDPLQDVAGLLLETGLRLGEALNLTWNDIEGDVLFVRQGKTVASARDIGLTDTAVAILEKRKGTANGCLWVFPNEAETGPALTTTLDHQHKRVRTKLSLSEEFVLHSLRHTALSRAAVACNGNVFELKEISGHTSTKMLERYVHQDGGNTKAILQAASSGHQVVTRRKPSKAKSLQTAVNKQAGA